MLLLQERQEQGWQPVISCLSYPKSSFTATELLTKILPGHKRELFLSCHLRVMTIHQRYYILLSTRHQWDSHSHMCKLIHQVTAALISVWASGENGRWLQHWHTFHMLLKSIRNESGIWEMFSKPEKLWNESVTKYTEGSVTNIRDLFM